jgi:hypothetical protein
MGSKGEEPGTVIPHAFLSELRVALPAPKIKSSIGGTALAAVFVAVERATPDCRKLFCTNIDEAG